LGLLLLLLLTLLLLLQVLHVPHCARAGLLEVLIRLPCLLPTGCFPIITAAAPHAAAAAVCRSLQRSFAAPHLPACLAWLVLLLLLLWAPLLLRLPPLLRLVHLLLTF
jgi:hypothetical protein